MTATEVIDLVTKVVSFLLAAGGTVIALSVKRDEQKRRLIEAQLKEAKAKQEAKAAAVKAEEEAIERQAEIDKLRHEIAQSITAGYLAEIKRLQDKIDEQEKRTAARDEENLRHREAQDKRIDELQEEVNLYRLWNQLMADVIRANDLPAVPMPERRRK